jgi:replicative DNA helicase
MTTAVEKTVVDMVAESFTGGSATVVTSAGAESGATDVTFADDFGAEFQTKLMSLALRDSDFMRKVSHLLRPEYFENGGEAAMVNMGLEFFKKYRQTPDMTTALNLLKAAKVAKTIRGDILPVAIDAFKHAFGEKVDVSNSTYAAECVAAFARHQAVSRAILNSVELLGKKKFDEIERQMKMAVEVGINSSGEGYDFFDEREARAQRRTEEALGTRPKTGITTGNLQMNELLYHKGWGRKELQVILGGPKSGKTTALIEFAKSACLAGFNVLYATCEVSNDIIADRMDANLSDTMMKDLTKKISEVLGKVTAFKSRAGALKFHEYPSGTLTPNELRQLIERYKSPAVNLDGTVREPIIFDLIVVDYADIMAPDNRTSDPIENSKSIYLALRAIAHENNAAVLSATQSNRAGATATVTKAEHVADDYNKVRTVDLLISINSTEEEKRIGEARLFFAASRNQESGFTLFIKQDLSKMKFLISIIKVE